MVEMISIAVHGINVLLTLSLLYIYSQNYRKIKSRYTIGLMVFAFIFLVQSLMGLYFDLSMKMYYSSEAEKIALFLEGIKAVALAVLLKISWE